MTDPGPRCCAGLLTIRQYIQAAKESVLDRQMQVSNSDQLLFFAWAIMVAEMSTSSLSFRSPETKSVHLKFSRP
jgi:hypothetical protein